MGKTRQFKHQVPHKGVLPEGNYYTLTWGIAYEFGGRTTVALERSSVLARQDNRQVTILTLAPEMKDQDREAELRAEGRIDRHVRVRNLWKDLTSWSDRQLRRMGGNLETNGAALADSLPRTRAGDWCEYRRSQDGTTLQVDRYSDSGNLLLIDRQDMHKRGANDGRLLTLLDSKGSIVGQWDTATGFYSAWLDVIFGDKPSYVVNDSKLTGRIFRHYRRDNVIFVQMLHNHFLKDQASRELVPSEFQSLHSLDRFDFAITLTEYQRAAMIDAGFSPETLRTVPNSTANLEGGAETPRDRSQGAMVARLVGPKRVEDALAAVAQSLSKVPSLTLDIYGDGEGRPRLEQVRQELGLSQAVHFHGHTQGAKQRFLEASFSVLSSRFEGQGLVLLESMSAGCIPIAYDIEFGPRDIITNGVNGFLVPPGDTKALSDAISHVATMSEAALTQMRRAALDRAADFFEQRIAQRWGEVLAEKPFSPITWMPDLQATLVSADVTNDSINLTVNVDGVDEVQPDQVAVSWMTRKAHFFSKTPALFDGKILTASIPVAGFTTVPPDRVDFSIDIVGGRNLNRVRITSADSNVGNNCSIIELYSTKGGNLSGLLPAEIVESDPQQGETNAGAVNI